MFAQPLIDAAVEHWPGFGRRGTRWRGPIRGGVFREVVGEGRVSFAASLEGNTDSRHFFPNCLPDELRPIHVKTEDSGVNGRHDEQRKPHRYQLALRFSYCSTFHVSWVYILSLSISQRLF